MKVLDELLRLVPPPTKPVEAGTPEGWPLAEEKLGLSLPQDYKELIGRYGTGCFAGYLWVLSPFAENPNLNVFLEIESVLSSAKDMKNELGEAFPFAGRTLDGGLLPWASSDEAHSLCWALRGPPEKWQTVVLEPRSYEFEVHKRTASEFLVAWLSGTLGTRLLPPRAERLTFETGHSGAFRGIPGHSGAFRGHRRNSP